MDLGADVLELLDHEPPASRCLQRNLERLTFELLKERADRIPVRGRDPCA
jgi:hypothetical protein